MAASTEEQPPHCAADSSVLTRSSSVHLTFGYRSDLKRFSDRVIRVHVQREPSRWKAELQIDTNTAEGTEQTDRSTQSVNVSPELSTLNQGEDNETNAVDLEMQPVAGGYVEGEDEGSEGSAYDIPVSSMIVAANSVYFRQMLTSGLNESNSKEQPIEVTLSPNEAPFFNALTEFMYTRDVNPTVRSDKESLCWLLTVADRFETASCVSKCVQLLTSTPTTLADAIMYVNLPETVKRCGAVRLLIDTVSELTGWSFEEIASAESFCEMDVASVRRLVLKLRGDEENEDEEQLCRLCLEWFRSNGRERWADFEALVLLLEFWRISRSFIRTELEPCPELRGPEGRALIERLRKMEPPKDAEAFRMAPAGQQAAAVAPAQGAAAVVNVPVNRPGRNLAPLLFCVLMVVGVLVILFVPLPAPKHH